jgi:WD40 repeat protein
MIFGNRFGVLKGTDMSDSASSAGVLAEPIIGDLARVGHIARVSDVVFNSDGRYFGTASNDGTARIWSGPPVGPPPRRCKIGIRSLPSPSTRTFVPSEKRCLNSSARQAPRCKALSVEVHYLSCQGGVARPPE